jgi:hypothetical protein
VYFVFSLDLVQCVVISATGYATLCTGWGRPSSLNVLNEWYTAPIPIVTATGTRSALFSQCKLDVILTHIAAFACQTFYAWRIYRFGGWITIPIVILFVCICPALHALDEHSHTIQLSLTQFSAGCALGIQVQYYYPRYISSTDH